MFRRLFAIISSFILTFCFCINRFAFEEPDNSYYVTVNTSQVGVIKIFIPYNYGSYFSTSYNGNRLVNCSSSTITCNALDSNNNLYSIRFPSFDSPSYRNTRSADTRYYDLLILGITDTNVPLLNDSNFGIFNQSQLVNMGCMLLLGVIVVLCIIRL